MKRLASLISIALIALVAGCSQQKSADSLVGTFGVVQNGTVVPFAKFEKQGDHFVDAIYVDVGPNGKGRWAPDSAPLKVAAKADLEQRVHHPVDFEVVGLSGPIVGIFAVPKGFKVGSTVIDTGYVVFSGGFPMPVQPL